MATGTTTRRRMAGFYLTVSFVLSFAAGIVARNEIVFLMACTRMIVRMEI